MPRSKPQVNLRRPPNPDAMASFVSGEADVQTPGDAQALEDVQTPVGAQTSESPLQLVENQGVHENAQTFKRSDPTIVTRKDGRRRRRTTVYLPPELAQSLKVRCALEGRELSALVTEALEAYLQPG